MPSSLAQEIDELRERVIKRLNELAPLAAEYAELKRKAEDLGIAYFDQKDVPPGSDEPAGMQAAAERELEAYFAPTMTPPRSSRRPQKRARLARRGAKKTARRRETANMADDLLKLATAQPGITVVEASEKLGVNPKSGPYRHAKRLVDEGKLRREGSGLYPVIAEPPPTDTGQPGPSARPPA
jgi:hypothetical protein